jgi:hypothetical protein
MYARVRLVTKILGEPKALNEAQVRELMQVRQKQGWGRTGGGGEADPQIVALVTQVVLEVLKAQGVTAVGSTPR